MKRILVKTTVFVALFALGACAAEKVQQWGVHDMGRPQPRVVAPGAEDRLPPSDAIVLFDGKDTSAWKNTQDGGAVKWKIQDGYMEVVPDAGSIITGEGFGSCQLHIEWASPEIVKGSGQGRGNSGIFLMSRYEVQILDSYQNETYPDGQAASVYGQNPPLVNACRKPGQWQSYDIIFHAPVFDGDTVVKPAVITVFHNGVLVQDHWIIKGITYHEKPGTYEPHPDKLPISLQDHGDLVRFRNIWIRPLD